MHRPRNKSAPEPQPAYAALGARVEGKVRALLQLDGQLFTRATQYPVVVERWDRRLSGKGKRRWLAEFTKRERRQAEILHTKLRRWYLLSGTPQKILLRADTIKLLQRLCDFFASLD